MVTSASASGGIAYQNIRIASPFSYHELTLGKHNLLGFLAWHNVPFLLSYLTFG